MRYSAFVFDAYGTLFDVHAAVRRHSEKIGPDGQLLSEIWRTKQLEYSWTRTLMGAPYQDFWSLTEQALDFAFAKIPSADPRHRDSLLEAYFRLDCYPEIPAVLAGLKSEGARVGILSNGSTKMLAAAVSSAGLDLIVDDVFSVDEVRRFKTDMSVYDLVTTAWRLYPDKISFQSSNRWDAAAAKQAGFRTVWLNRTGQPDEYRDLAPDLVLPSLDGLIAQS
jgi:2-haloacid dehalogenase